MKLDKSLGKIQILFWTLLFIFLLSIIVFEIYTLVIFYKEGNLAIPDNFGNFKHIREKLITDKKRKEFSFAVIGDTRGYGAWGFGSFEKIAAKLKKEDLSFMIMLGDCVRRGRPGYHRYLRAEIADDQEFRMPFPIFYVVGNHDVDPKQFPISEFEKFYGPTNFYFNYQGNLFIFLRVLIDPFPTDESIKFLESILEKEKDKHKRTFVFMHTPVSLSKYHKTKLVKNSQKLKNIFEKYKVDYVITGDYHGYFRQEHNDTKYIITGGGGSELEDSRFGQFYHAIIMTIKPNSVSEDILFADRDEDFIDSLECLALAEVYPWLKAYWVLAIVFNLVVILLCFLAIKKILYLINKNILKEK
ncbi:MAG: metallophosphoesterase [Candidatus Omnitrophica bacterium]|nr:metallophosphoesterase [Candidatus Omnitrophota bacterium]MCF7887640.1 metallophosphoesterase [Candidatus Omnitrophota bacterium]MCF7894979.1 metallophosphoesterase [Candidatus Omnitrophota bacterium]